jgi:alanine dehydrogenase
LISMSDALAAVESSFKEQSAGTGINLPRHRVHQPNGTLHLMGAALSQRGYWGFKAYTATRNGVRFSINLYDGNTGELLAILEADYIGQLRTGAASGIATKYLVKNGASKLALLGSGSQAATQLAAIAAVVNLQEVRVYSRNPDHRAAFARQMSATLGINIQPVDTPAQAVSDCDILTTITTSSTPVFSGSDLPAGVHINAAGSNSVSRTELDLETIKRVDLFFTDDYDQAKLECGDLIHAYERNVFNWSRLHLLADVISGKLTGRTSPADITLFESHGIALWDIALAAEVYDRARDAKLGTEIDFGE